MIGGRGRTRRGERAREVRKGIIDNELKRWSVGAIVCIWME